MDSSSVRRLAERTAASVGHFPYGTGVSAILPSTILFIATEVIFYRLPQRLEARPTTNVLLPTRKINIPDIINGLYCFHQ